MKLLRSYFFWTYERGSFHYDVMVTLILLFLFLSPRFIDYRDRPVPDLPQHNSEVVVEDNGVVTGGHEYIYQLRSGRLRGDTSSDAALRDSFNAVIQPIAGTVQIERYQPVKDAHGSIVGYSVWVLR